MRRAAPNIDAYIAEFPGEVAAKLQEIRKLVKDLAPEAEETISYGIPTFKLNGPLVYFAGFKHHIGFYPGGPDSIVEFRNELAQYKTSKGTVQFPLDQPLPTKLLTKIVTFRIQQNLEKKK